MNNLDFFGLLPINAFKRIGKRMTLEGGKQDAPPAPDYTGAANATAAGNLEAARAAAAANRVNQYGPNGSLVYTHDESQGDGGWSATTTLTPEAQAIKAQNDALSAQYGQIAQQGINAIQPFAFSSGSAGLACSTTINGTVVLRLLPRDSATKAVSPFLSISEKPFMRIPPIS